MVLGLAAHYYLGRYGLLSMVCVHPGRCVFYSRSWFNPSCVNVVSSLVYRQHLLWLWLTTSQHPPKMAAKKACPSTKQASSTLKKNIRVGAHKALPTSCTDFTSPWMHVCATPILHFLILLFESLDLDVFITLISKIVQEKMVFFFSQCDLQPSSRVSCKKNNIYNL